MKEMSKEKLLGMTKEKLVNLITGELKIQKRELFLTTVLCFVLGVLSGIFIAPLTKGVQISLFSHNGSENGNNNTTLNEDDCCCDDECCSDEASKDEDCCKSEA